MERKKGDRQRDRKEGKKKIRTEAGIIYRWERFYETGLLLKRR